MTNPSLKQDDTQKIWEFIPISEYKSPEVPVSQVTRKGLSQIWRIFRQEEEKSEVAFKPESDLRTLDASQLEQISSAPNWEAGGSALRETLQTWLKSDRIGQNIVFLVEPPHGGHAEKLMAWATQNDVTIVSPPTPEQIMENADVWLASLPERDTFWIYPTLEKTYLRHASGLSLMRRFLDRAASGAMGLGVIGCDSWAWAYLQHVWHGSWPSAITSKASDQTQLVRQFQRMLRPKRGTTYLFCQADNGAPLFSTGKEDNNSEKTSDYLQQLAAFSHGNIGVAQAIWRDSLCIEPDEALREKQNDDEDATLASQVIWVTPWDDLEHPSLPAKASEQVAFVLHTLLLHNGLSFELLQQLLPLAGNQIMETVSQLTEAGLVTYQDKTWKVAARGYPVVRSYLKSNGYLCDAF
ncbi:hypothetical protein [Candidatus Chloroploca asiatica]|uniref:Uncharacterized protein n=1 Tax=Candidatus Chloroploca asiatica TaxID=1506545 RepID=A0A2H3KX10_9CHLR|nr:hypothetical protein [Candidatus Chloroploca asiatica]PDV96911.1 hypothetical protein A9Q02_19920 [Candidatus Chloroploca asiatica]